MNTQNKYWELHTSCLVADTVLPFDIYIWQQGKPILWRGKSTELLQKDIGRLIESGVNRVAISIRDKEKYLEYLEPITQKLILDDKVPPEYKAYIVRESTSKVLSKLFKEPTNARTAKRLESLVFPIIDLLMSGSSMAPLKFLIGSGSMAFSYAPHGARTCYYTIAFARSYANYFTEDKIRQLAMGALLHDVGQMLVKPAIREKEGKFTDKERSEMEKHPVHSVNIIKRGNIFVCNEATMVAVKSHHELGDKSGYPLGLPLFELPLEANILAIAHTFESYTVQRVHRNAAKSYDVIKYFLDNPGKYQPKFVKKFVKVLAELEVYSS